MNATVKDVMTTHVVAVRKNATFKDMVASLLVDPARFTITVSGGQVTIEGTPETSPVGHDIIEEVRHVEGVVSVRDKLEYPSDRSWPIIAGSRF